MVRIVGTELRHLHTLRLAVGDGLRVFDEGGEEHEISLEQVGVREARARVIRTYRPERESCLALTLAPALLKGAKMDLLIEKTTELGVTAITPCVSKHTIGRGVALDRWRRSSRAATEHCGRTPPPEIAAPVPFADLLRAPRRGLAVLAWEDEDTVRLSALPPSAPAVTILTGPEGGFAAPEVAAAKAAGFVAVSLGTRILRAETAAIIATALGQARWGDLG